jgi:serine/threonine protein kinase
MWKKTVSLKLLNLLGEGSQGSVYKALRLDSQTGLRQVVAVKILHSQTTVDLWRLEFESLSRVRSQYCIQVLSFERHLGRPALILEYVDGISMTDLVQWGHITDGAAHEIMAQLECALKDLHSQGVFHGDLSPQNIMIDRKGRIRLLDFGLANSSENTLRLTPRFAAPERLRGDPSTEASDLYSLGRVEEFLWGQHRTDYLDREPSRRCFQDLQTSPEGLRSVTDLVASALQKKHSQEVYRTESYQASSPRLSQKTAKVFRCGIVLASSLMILATSSASQIKFAKQNQISCLVKTKQWHFLVLNGKPLGYAPADLSLVAGATYRLEWISARGRGSVQIQPKLRHPLVLTDSDFSH